MLSSSPDRYCLCSRCPNRHMAEVFAEMGLQERSLAILEAGCQWWVERVPGLPDETTGAPVDLTGCFAGEGLIAVLRLKARFLGEVSAEVVKHRKAVDKAVAAARQHQEQLVEGLLRLVPLAELASQAEAFAVQVGPASDPPDSSREERMLPG